MGVLNNREHMTEGQIHGKWFLVWINGKFEIVWISASNVATIKTSLNTNVPVSSASNGSSFILSGHDLHVKQLYMYPICLYTETCKYVAHLNSNSDLSNLF